MIDPENIPASFNEPLLCMKCGNEGNAVWEDGHLAHTSERFRLRTNLSLTADPEVVCMICGTVLVEHRYFKPAIEPARMQVNG